eukprot:EG_transcript_16112
MRSGTTAVAALPIGGRLGQRGPTAVGRTRGLVPATLGHSTADREGIGPTSILGTLAAALAALIVGVSLGRRLIRWLLKGPLAEMAEQKPAHRQYPEFCDPRAPTTQWCCLATATSSPQPAYLPKEDGRDGADGEIPLRLPRAEVQQHLEEYDIDVLKVAKRFPPLERYDLERVAVVTSFLAGLGVDVKRAVEAYPLVLGGKVEKYEAVVGLLRANGVDVANAVTRNPNVLARRVETLQRTMAAIARCGHSVAAVVRRQPAILRANPAGISAMLQLHSLTMPLEDGSAAVPLELADPMVALFSSVGLDAGRLLKRAPGAFNFSVGYLQAAVANLERIGVDVPKVLHSAPTVLTLLPETPQRVVQF